MIDQPNLGWIALADQMGNELINEQVISPLNLRVKSYFYRLILLHVTCRQE